MSVALVTVVSGTVYEDYAQDMFQSAFEFFGPDPVVAHIALPGRPGWPDATLYRYHALLENDRILCRFDHVFMVDADMLFVAPVGPEILGKLTATVHPGYVGKPPHQLPLETNRESRACAAGSTYFCGGFVGGEACTVLMLADTIQQGIDRDNANGVLACWHDESHLNAALHGRRPPSTILSPAYCFPQDASAYPWLSGVERKLVAVDKTPVERAGR